MSKKLSEHEINEIIGMHQSGLSNAEIREKTGRSSFVIRKYILQNEKIKKCPKCGQACPHPQAHFCFICGTKILTEREEVIEQLSYIRGSFALVPEKARDRFMNAANTAIRYLEGLDES